MNTLRTGQSATKEAAFDGAAADHKNQNYMASYAQQIPPYQQQQHQQS